MAIQVKNESAQEIEVAINQWGDDGNTSFFRIKPECGSESWDRTDERGYVMVVKQKGSQLPYYVQAGSNISVSDENVTDRGSVMSPV